MKWNYAMFTAIVAMLGVATVTSWSIFNFPKQSSEHNDLQCPLLDGAALSSYEKYQKGMDKIYSLSGPYPCMASHKYCGWQKSVSDRPLLVIAIGTEGSGHQMWNMLFQTNIFDCIWPKESSSQPLAGSHYEASNFPFMTTEELHESLANLQAQSSREVGRQCRTIYNAFDTFPHSPAKVKGRVFHHMDLASVQQLDGDLFDVKYLILVRNSTDAALTSLGRGGVGTLVDQNLRTYEQMMVYLERALERVPCHKKFVAHFEHVRADPLAFVEPLATFFQLDDVVSAVALRRSLADFGLRKKSVKTYPIRFAKECPGGLSEKACYAQMAKKYDVWFGNRAYMWPTFAGNGHLSVN